MNERMNEWVNTAYTYSRESLQISSFPRFRFFSATVKPVPFSDVLFNQIVCLTLSISPDSAQLSDLLLSKAFRQSTVQRTL